MLPTAATHAMHEEGLQMVKNREDQKWLPNKLRGMQATDLECIFYKLKSNP